MTIETIRDRRQYCLDTLALPGVNPARRAILTAKLAGYDAELADRCSKCGRPISLPASVARSMGATCAGHTDDERTD